RRARQSLRAGRQPDHRIQRAGAPRQRLVAGVRGALLAGGRGRRAVPSSGDSLIRPRLVAQRWSDLVVPPREPRLARRCERRRGVPRTPLERRSGGAGRGAPVRRPPGPRRGRCQRRRPTRADGRPVRDPLGLRGAGARAPVFFRGSHMAVRLTATAAFADVTRLLLFPLRLRVDYSPAERTLVTTPLDPRFALGLLCFAVWAALLWLAWRRGRRIEA